MTFSKITDVMQVMFEQMEDNGLVFIFTDSPTKNLDLMEKLLAKQIEMNLTVISVFYPKYRGQCEDKSWKFYKKLGKVFELEDEKNQIRSLMRSTLKFLFEKRCENNKTKRKTSGKVTSLVEETTKTYNEFATTALIGEQLCL